MLKIILLIFVNLYFVVAHDPQLIFKCNYTILINTKILMFKIGHFFFFLKKKKNKKKKNKNKKSFFIKCLFICY